MSWFGCTKPFFHRKVNTDHAESVLSAPSLFFLLHSVTFLLLFLVSEDTAEKGWSGVKTEREKKNKIQKGKKKKSDRRHLSCRHVYRETVLTSKQTSQLWRWGWGPTSSTYHNNLVVAFKGRSCITPTQPCILSVH